MDKPLRRFYETLFQLFMILCRLDLRHIWRLCRSILLMWGHLLPCGKFDVFYTASVNTVEPGNRQQETCETLTKEEIESSLRGYARSFWMFVEREARV